MGVWMDRAKQLKADSNGSDEPTTLALKPPDKETPTHVPPLQPGWLVVYRDRQGVLCGGPDDREHGTVDRCVWNGTHGCLSRWQNRNKKSGQTLGQMEDTVRRSEIPLTHQSRGK